MHHTYHTFDWTCDYCQTIISGVRPNKCYEIECDLQGTQWICEQCYQPRPQTNPTKPHPKLALTTPPNQKEQAQ